MSDYYGNSSLFFLFSDAGVLYDVIGCDVIKIIWNVEVLVLNSDNLSDNFWNKITLND